MGGGGPEKASWGHLSLCAGVSHAKQTPYLRATTPCQPQANYF